jgi:catechol-2,3-dioxygenase
MTLYILFPSIYSFIQGIYTFYKTMKLDGLVIFVRDLHAMTAFYQALTSGHISDESSRHVTLSVSGAALTLHKASGVESDNHHQEHPICERRETTPLKSVWRVSNAISTRKLVVDLGGGAVEVSEAWRVGNGDGDGDFMIDAWDPEGNVFTLCGPS